MASDKVSYPSPPSIIQLNIQGWIAPVATSPSLSKLYEPETRISSLDVKADSVLGTLTVDVQKIQELKERLTQMEADAKTKLETSNKQIDEVNNIYIINLHLASKTKI